MAGEKCTEEFWEAVMKSDDELPEEPEMVCKKRKKHGAYQDWTEVSKEKIIRGQYDCPIVTYDRNDDKIIIDNCGYETKSTKDRINNVIRRLGHDVFQRDFEWYIDDKSKPFYENNVIRGIKAKNYRKLAGDKFNELHKW